MLPGFAFTIFAYWYPTWVDRSIPVEHDSRIWMLVGLTLGYTWWASATVVVAFLFLVTAAFRLRRISALPPITFGLLMCAPSAYLVWIIGAVWLGD
jgi:hypothetical protein